MFDIDECELRYDRNSEEGSVVCDVNSRFFFVTRVPRFFIISN